LISQASSEHSITFSTIQEDAIRAKEAIAEEFAKELQQEKIANIDITEYCSIIAAVGDGMHFVCGVSGRFFGALGDAQISVLAISQGCSERNISAVVRQSQSTRALRALHAAFHLSHTTVRLAVVGMNEVGESLLRLLEVQRSIIRKTFDIDLQVCSVAVGSKDTDIWCLSKENGGEEEDSITVSAIRAATGPPVNPSIQFEQKAPDNVVKSSFCKDLNPILVNLLLGDCAHHVIFDCTNDTEASDFHPRWLEAGIHVVTANNTGLSGSLELRDSIERAENLHGKQSALYLREVRVF
jgi:aspartokinase/homoserine dehydrogenase 1